ncbi:ATP-dependent zinc metalloprotease FtsH [Brevibacterium litoralis]|uniref:ATP-dependent zinc metalloprotease FtsH n=1 Tax=Brevibacterium litoralis TaxID=3138935 RepID=UPI0032ECE261
MAETKDSRPRMTKWARGPLLWIVLAILVVTFGALWFGGGGFQRVDTEQGLELLADGKVEQAKIVDGDQRVDLVLTEDYSADGHDYGDRVQFFYVEPRGEAIVAAVDAAAPEKGFTDEIAQQNWFTSLLINLIPFVIIFLVFWFLLSRMGGGKGIMNIGKSKAKLVNKENPDVTFTDVAGVEEALEELEEIKDFLSEPQKFQDVGAKIPKGVLLYGAPGTGKTLLAKAVAGEAGVPFYSISGSDFVEMYVGVGASRVRDLFDQAKQNSPCIIFIDEIDAVGRKRGSGMGGGHDEREQTLNQLLVEMDGFDATTNIILIAATNRPDVLDPALLRPGRFDRQVQVEAADLKGRTQILEVHGRNKPLAEDVDLAVVAKRTPGFSGADLANVLNEAALLTARQGRDVITKDAIYEAIDRVIAGPQKRTRLMNDKERLTTAYHEGGHALVAAAMNDTDPVTKITILPRGKALGFTVVMPEEDKYSTSRNELLDQLAYAMGGRAAEEIIFHDPTSGASNDIEKATKTARAMVTQYGMSEKLGMVKIGESDPEPMAGAYGPVDPHADSTVRIIDEEVRTLIDEALADAHWAINTNRGILDRLAHELLEKETLNEPELREIFAEVVKRPRRDLWLASEDRPVSDQPPIAVPPRLSENGNGTGNGNGSGSGDAGGVPQPPRPGTAPQPPQPGVPPQPPQPGAQFPPPQGHPQPGDQFPPAPGGQNPPAGPYTGQGHLPGHSGPAGTPDQGRGEPRGPQDPQGPPDKQGPRH